MDSALFWRGNRISQHFYNGLFRCRHKLIVETGQRKFRLENDPKRLFAFYCMLFANCLALAGCAYTVFGFIEGFVIVPYSTLAVCFVSGGFLLASLLLNIVLISDGEGFVDWLNHTYDLELFCTRFQRGNSYLTTFKTIKTGTKTLTY